MDTNVPVIDRSVTSTVTDATDRPEYDAHALLAEVVLRFEFAGLLPKGRPLPDPRGAHKAATDLLIALGVNPVDLGMSRRIAKRVAALAGDAR